MRFWKWLLLKTEIFEKPFKPLYLITNSKKILQDSRHYEPSKKIRRVLAFT
jgi:hypothetical protein